MPLDKRDSESMYTLRFPFRLPEGKILSPLEEPASASCDELSVTLSRHSDSYLLTVTPFSDEEAAVAFIPMIYAGLTWTMLQYDLSIEYDMEPQSIHYLENPCAAAQRLFGRGADVDRVDAVIDGARPAVTIANRSISFMVAGQGSITTGVNANMALAVLTEAAMLPRAEAVIQNRKLRTALDLYNVFFREQSGNTRFLTLMMALEALTLNERKPSCVLALLDGWVGDLQRIKATIEETTEEWSDYDDIEKEITYRKEVSIRKKIRTLVRQALYSQGSEAAAAAAKKAVRLYDQRSRLVHDGYLPAEVLRKGTQELKEIVCDVLKAQFAQVAGQGRHRPNEQG